MASNQGCIKANEAGGTGLYMSNTSHPWWEKIPKKTPILTRNWYIVTYKTVFQKKRDFFYIIVMLFDVKIVSDMKTCEVWPCIIHRIPSSLALLTVDMCSMLFLSLPNVLSWQGENYFVFELITWVYYMSIYFLKCQRVFIHNFLSQ